MEKPKHRSVLRLKLGARYYGARRKPIWLKNRKHFAKNNSEKKLEFSCFSHKTPLLRKLKCVDLWMQYNKEVI